MLKPFTPEETARVKRKLGYVGMTFCERCQSKFQIQKEVRLFDALQTFNETSFVLCLTCFSEAADRGLLKSQQKLKK